MPTQSPDLVARTGCRVDATISPNRLLKGKGIKLREGWKHELDCWLMLHISIIT